MASADGRELILIPSLEARRDSSGRLLLTKKYLNGVERFRKHWRGRVTSLVRTVNQPSTELDLVEVGPADGIEVRPEDPLVLSRRLAEGGVVLAFLSPLEEPLLKMCEALGVPVVMTSEYSVRTEFQILDAEVKNPILRWRRKLWTLQAEKTRRRMLPRLAGLQCSGTPTYDAYGRHTRNPLLFFDNRVAVADLLSEEQLEAKLAPFEQEHSGERPHLRLVFGGRWIRMKGVMWLPKVARALRRRGVAFHLSIYGDGPLRNELERAIDAQEVRPWVHLHGPLDFRTEWIPTLRKRCDIFVCCHPQGDPSSTYPEVMSCGVPIAGFDNEAFRGVWSRSRGGWLVPMGEVDAMADAIARLNDNRGAIATAARNARRFAAEHAFERTFGRRAEHLLKAARP